MTLITKIKVKVVMKNILATLLLLMCFTHTSYGNENFKLTSPEGWAMAFMNASIQNLGQMPPKSVNIGDVSISAELSSIPHLTKDQQRIGFGGFKDEDLNKTPVFGRLRSNIGLPWDINAEISWTPPLRINNSNPNDLWGAALSTPIFNNQKIGVGLRLFMLRGGITASVTCSEDVVSFAPYTPENFVGCVGLSNDKLQINQEGAEIFISFNNSSKMLPWISFASISIDSSVDIDAPLADGRERITVHSNGSIKTISFGFNYDLNKNLDLNISSSYTPLDVRRQVDNSDNDNFWNVRLGLSLNF